MAACICSAFMDGRHRRTAADSSFSKRSLALSQRRMGACAGWLDPKGPAAGVPTPPSQLSREAHAGFAHVATMLKGQGIVDPAGDQHLTSVLVEFFEARMVRPGLNICDCWPAHASSRIWQVERESSA